MTERTRSQGGVSLAEALVAITVLALASTAAMVLYSGARRSYKVGSNLTEQQQNVRIAFDELTEDLRLAGFNVHPDGDRRRPDEQIELAQTTAIVIRADFDAGDPSAALTPEETLADTANGSKFYTVSTGNDEIRAYVLANEDSTGSLAFEADLGGPVRDGEVEPIVIDDVSLTQDDPPYTLYRVTWDAAGGEVREPLVDQISTLRFVYYDERGQVVAPVPGEDDADGLNERSRAGIRRIGVDVEGLTRDADLQWTEGVAVANEVGTRRRFDLAADVTPRNLGLFGVRDLNSVVSPPQRPPPPSLYEGHCHGLWAEWAPNPPQDEVARYELRWGTDVTDISHGPVYAENSEVYLDGLDTGPTAPPAYYVTVTAVDDSGSPSQPSPPSTRPTSNLNTPEAVTDAVATDDVVGRIELSWSEVTDNVESVPSQDPLSPEMRDAAGYRIERDGVALATHHPVASYEDQAIVNCRAYNYRVAAVDECEKPGGWSNTIAGESVYTTAPLPPQGVQAFWAGPAYNSSIRVEWSPVTQDVNGQPITMLNYKIFRYQGPSGMTNFSSVTFAMVNELTAGETAWLDIGIFGGPNTGTSYYYLTTRDYCINESAPSAVAWPQCNFTGDVVLLQPQANQMVPNGPVWLQATVSGGAGAYSLEYRVVHFGTNQVMHQQVVASPGMSQWDATGDPVGIYRIDVTATQQLGGCQEVASIFVNKNS